MGEDGSRLKRADRAQFDRAVFCLAGLPVDAVNLSQAVDAVIRRVQDRTRCFISTPNLNMLVSGRKDTQVRESIVQSDLIIADGMPLVWMTKLLGIPLPERVAGSGLFEALRDRSATPGSEIRVTQPAWLALSLQTYESGSKAPSPILLLICALTPQ
jgi:UDP-N-acetyl-D-mannosaminuronic acid transferase (WecB/TagA/CpsF family)